MIRTFSLSCLACILLLGGCAHAPAPQAPPTIVTLMTNAEIVLKRGQYAQGIGMLKVAATTYPHDKAPVLRIAQVHFDCHEYGEAITWAQRALERDPDDILAHSIVAVSGLRVSSKALSDLTIQNDLTGTVRAEAQDLARLLRSSIGGDIILPATRTGHGKSTQASGNERRADPLKAMNTPTMEPQ